MTSHFGAWVYTQLAGRSMTQRTLAQRTDLSPSYIGDIVNGNRVPPHRVVDLIADTLGASKDFAATLCNYLPHSMEGITEDDMEAVVAFLRVRRLMREYDEPLVRHGVDGGPA